MKGGVDDLSVQDVKFSIDGTAHRTRAKHKATFYCKQGATPASFAESNACYHAIVPGQYLLRVRVVEVANHHRTPCGVDHVCPIRMIAQPGRENGVPDSVVQLHPRRFNRLPPRCEGLACIPWLHNHGVQPQGRGGMQGVPLSSKTIHPMCSCTRYRSALVLVEPERLHCAILSTKPQNAMKVNKETRRLRTNHQLSCTRKQHHTITPRS